jgi:hypothetical protein
VVGLESGVDSQPKAASHSATPTVHALLLLRDTE